MKPEGLQVRSLTYMAEILFTMKLMQTTLEIPIQDGSKVVSHLHLLLYIMGTVLNSMLVHGLQLTQMNLHA